MAVSPHKRQIKQKWLVGQRVCIEKLQEPALVDVPKCRLKSNGIISKAYLKFPSSKQLCHMCYLVRLDSEILSSMDWIISPGYDTLKVDLLIE